MKSPPSLRPRSGEKCTFRASKRPFSTLMLTHLFRLPLSSASPLMCEPLARQVQAFDAHATSAEPTVRVPSLPEHEQVGWWCRRQGLRWRRGRRRWRRLWRPRKRWCRRRRPVVSASSSSSLQKTCAADSFISAQLNWPAAVVRACPAAPLHRHRAACRFGHSSLRDLRVLKEGRLAAGCSVAGRYVASYSVAGM